MSEHSCYESQVFLHCNQLLCYNCFRSHMLTSHGKDTYLHNRSDWMTWDYQFYAERPNDHPNYKESRLKLDAEYVHWKAKQFIEGMNIAELQNLRNLGLDT